MRMDGVAVEGDEDRGDEDRWCRGGRGGMERRYNDGPEWLRSGGAEEQKCSRRKDRLLITP